MKTETDGVLDDSAAVQWEKKYQSSAEAHRRQNTAITKDFARSLKTGSRMHTALSESKKVLEVGCGTGEMAAWVSDTFRSDVTGVDLSPTAICAAREKHGKKGRFLVGSFADIKEHYDLVIASNVLEHFVDYHGVLSDWLRVAPLAIVVVPYREAVEASPGGVEGALRHSSRFDEASLEGFRMVDSLVFASSGWRCGDEPRQWAVMVQR